MSKHSAAFHYLRHPPFPSQHKNFNPLKTRFIANKVVLSLLLCSFSRFTAELSLVTQRWRVHFSSSKGNKHGRWTGGKLIFTIILITFRRFYCTGTFQNICLSRWAHKNMGVRRGRASFVKDGSIFKRARAAAACSGAAQAGGGDVTVSRRSFCHRSGGGEVAVHTFTPRRYLGGGDFFYLPFYLQHLSSFKLCSLFYILLSDAQPMKMVPWRKNRIRTLSRWSHFHPDPTEGRTWVNYDKGSELEAPSTCPVCPTPFTIIR